MHIAIQLFARARDLAGADKVTVTLPEGATVRDLRRELATQHPRLAGLLEHSALAVNNDFADDFLSLPFNAEVALLPPVSGG
jgi:molybdopterin converting factor subunit 1